MADRKMAMIWGANGGIGKAILTLLAKNNWQVAAISRQPDALTEWTPYSFEADVNNEMQIKSAVLEANYELEEIDLWIYAMGDILSATTDEMSASEWQRIINANLTGAFLATHHSLPLLKENAHLFYLGAVSERLRLPKLSAYVAAKAGLEAYTEALRKEQRKKRVTVVRPGAVATPFWEKVPLRMPSDAASPEKVAKRILQAYDEGHAGQLDLV